MTELLSSSGTLHYSLDGGLTKDQAEHYEGQPRLVVEVDPELARYYRSLIPKWIETNKPRWPAHITVVRPFKEKPPNMEPWGKYQGEVVEFKYQNLLHTGKVYFWINVFCKRLEEIRAELGLPVTSEFTRPPEGFLKCFHCTIANCK